MTLVDTTAADCVFLGLCIYREARGEPLEAQIGVAWVVLNRVNHKGWFGSTISQVLFKKWQFSSLTDPHDPQLENYPLENDTAWAACLKVANDCMFNNEPDNTQGADSYYDDSIPPPSWTHSGQLTTKIGRLNFYRTTGKIVPT